MTETKIYRLPHQVTYYECEPSGHISLSALIALLILASERQNAALGVDEFVTLKMGGSWVIIDYEAEFTGDWPKQNEHIELDTIILAYNKYFVVRKFSVRNQAGTVIGVVKGLFVYMDLTKRKMDQIPESIMKPYQMGMTIRLPKVARPDKATKDETWLEREYRVRYFDIDYNGHVNNAKYFDWMLDLLDPEFLKQHQIERLRMNYEHEVRPRTTVVSQASRPVETDGQLVTHHHILVGDDLCASATITWRSN